MTPTEIYISAYTDNLQISSNDIRSGCLVTKFDIEMNDIAWTIVMTDKIDNKCGRVVVDN